MDGDDDMLLRRIDEAFGPIRRPAAEAVAVAAAAWSWGPVDRELAELLSDSLTATGLRSVGSSERILSLRAGPHLVELLVTPAGRQLEIQLIVSDDEEGERALDGLVTARMSGPDDRRTVVEIPLLDGSAGWTAAPGVRLSAVVDVAGRLFETPWLAL